MRALLDNASIVFESRTAVRDALAGIEAGGAGFPDRLIVASAKQAGCGRTLSFDRRMGSLPGDGVRKRVRCHRLSMNWATNHHRKYGKSRSDTGIAGY